MSRPADPGEAFWDARRGPLTFFLFAWASAISLNLWTVVVQERAPDWLLWIVLSVPVVGVGVILSKWFPYFWRPSRIQAQGITLRRGLAPERGLVVIASQGRGIAAAEVAIRHHAPRLERLWVVVSTSAAPSWQELRAKLIEQSVLTPEKIVPIELSDSALDDPETIHHALEDRVFSQLPEGLKEDQVLLDMTSGPKTTSAGTFLAGLPPGRRLELVLPKGKDEHGYATEGDEPVELAISYRLKRAKPR